MPPAPERPAAVKRRRAARTLSRRARGGGRLDLGLAILSYLSRPGVRLSHAVLELAINLGHQVAAVSCPDLETDALRIGALNHQLPILPGRLTAAMVPAGLDLIVAAHCHAFLSEKTRLRAELGALGYHPSLLPRHRGRSAIEWAIRMGEKVTGGSVYWLNDAVDGGPVAAQDWCFIRPDDTAGALWNRELFPMGLRLFARAFAHLEAGVIVAEPQDRSLATWEPAVANVPALWRPDVPLLGASRFQIVPDRRATLPGQEAAA